MTDLRAFKVFWNGQHPKPKKQYHPGTFNKRQQARQWCRKRSWLPGLHIEHPGGVTEAYLPKLYP